MGKLKEKIFFLLIVGLMTSNVMPTAEVMKQVTLKFGEALEHCRVESKLSNDMMEEFFHFWRDDFKFVHRELGCTLLCMSKHFDLLTDDHRMDHSSTDDFIKSFENGEKLSKRMIEIIHSCEKKFNHETDNCMRILKIAECFKNDSVAEGIAPNMEMMMAEMIMANE